jgi:hypothetical protein
VDTTMTGLAREAATMRDTVTQTVRQHLDDLSTRFDAPLPLWPTHGVRRSPNTSR